MSTRLAGMTSIGLITGEIIPPTRSLRGAARAFATAATRFDEAIVLAAQLIHSDPDDVEYRAEWEACQARIAPLPLPL